MTTMNSNSTINERGQKKTSRCDEDERTWRCDEDDKLMQFLKEMCQDGRWKAEGGLKAGYLIHLEKLFAEAMPDAGLKATNIDSRLGYLQKRFNALLEIKHKESDFGWDKEQKTVTGDHGTFDQWAKSESKELLNHNSQAAEVASKATDCGNSTEEGDQGAAKSLEKVLLVAVQDASPTNGNTSDGPPNQEVKSEGTAIKDVLNDLEEDECMNESGKLLSDKLSAALMNVNLKDDLVKQHAKVAEEAVVGWEKAESEVAVMNRQLEVVVQQKVAVEARVIHLDEALKECVRQLRLVNEEQESRISEAVAEKTDEWKVIKTKYESQVAELQAELESCKAYSSDPVCPELHCKLEYLEKENTLLKEKLLSQSEELEVRVTERDLSIKAAETASKQHLESIKKMAKLEAECRRLKALYRKPPSLCDQKSTAASCVESLTDSQSDNGEQLCVEVESRGENGLGSNECELSHSDSWAIALIAELDQFKSEKLAGRSLPSSSVEIDLMDDFLEMERLAALPQSKRENCVQSEVATGQSSNVESTLRNELVAMTHRTGELEKKIELMLAEMTELNMALIQSRNCLETSHVQLIEMEMKMEKMQLELHEVAELKQAFELRATGLDQETKKMSSHIESLHAELIREQALSAEVSNLYKELEIELQRKTEELEQNAVSDYELKEKEIALTQSRGQLEKLQTQLKEAETIMEQLQRELLYANEAKQQLESQLADVRMEAEALSAQIESGCAQREKDQSLSSKLSAKCRELEIELKKHEQVNQRQSTCSSNELKMKQEDLTAAAVKLAECQKTISSLGTQLKSLATLEDYLIDTASIPGFLAPASVDTKDESEPWKIHCNGTYSDRKEIERLKNSHECFSPSTVSNGTGSMASSSKSSESLKHCSSEESGLSFGKLFSLSRS